MEAALPDRTELGQQALIHWPSGEARRSRDGRPVAGGHAGEIRSVAARKQDGSYCANPATQSPNRRYKMHRMETAADRLRRFREQKGIDSGAELARLAGVPEATYRAYQPVDEVVVQQRGSGSKVTASAAV
jgi:hypothetical protein